MSKPGRQTHELSRLEKRHAELKERVAQLDSLLHLTPAQQMERQRLKKEKLQAKDSLRVLVQN